MHSEAVTLLSRYIRIDTSNPPGNEKNAAEFFARILADEGIVCELFEPSPGRVSLRAEIVGTHEKEPLILLNHMDVVPAVREQWSFDPFGGEILNGYVCGRGALDMKSLGIMELMAFLHIQRRKIVPRRKVIFLAVADEETGGKYGIEYLLKAHEQEFAAGLVLNEGGFGIEGLIADRSVHMISSAEKGPCWLRLTQVGQSGHASVPQGVNALEKLIAALNRFLSLPKPYTLTPMAAEYFRRLADGWEFLRPFSADGKEETLMKCLRDSGLLNIPEIAAMLQNSASLTMLQAGEKNNVIPSRAEAWIDARLLPGQSVEAFTDLVRRTLADDDIQLTTQQAYPSTESPWDTEDFQRIENVIRRNFPASVITPSLLAGTTDSRFFRSKGIWAYGFFPVVISLAEIKSIHGVDERISIENLERGTQVFTELVEELCR